MYSGFVQRKTVAPNSRHVPEPLLCLRRAQVIGMEAAMAGSLYRVADKFQSTVVAGGWHVLQPLTPCSIETLLSSRKMVNRRG